MVIYREGLFLDFFRFDVSSLSCGVKHGSFLYVFGRRARTRAGKNHWVYIGPFWPTLIFLAHPPIKHCWKDIKCVHRLTRIERACDRAHITHRFFLVHPWCLLYYQINFPKNRTSLSRAMMGYKMRAGSRTPNMCRCTLASTNNFTQI